MVGYEVGDVAVVSFMIAVVWQWDNERCVDCGGSWGVTCIGVGRGEFERFAHSKYLRVE